MKTDVFGYDIELIRPSDLIWTATSVELRPLSSYHENYQNYNLKFRGVTLNTPMLESRTWGWYKDLPSAEKSVLKSPHWFYENSFQWVVIESIPTGNLAYRCHQYFYSFNKFKDNYIRIKRCPRDLRKYFNSIGAMMQFTSMG